MNLTPDLPPKPRRFSRPAGSFWRFTGVQIHFSNSGRMRLAFLPSAKAISNVRLQSDAQRRTPKASPFRSGDQNRWQ
jgi:hypothetical protein